MNIHANQLLRDRLAEITAQIAALKAERKRVCYQLGAMTYPVLTLPVELTSKIFVYCLPPFSASQPFTQDQPPAVLLSHVCSHWRSVAFATQELWDSFNIPSQVSRTPSRSQLLIEWIDRAGSAPLSVVLNNSLFRSILSCPERWRDADLRFSYETLLFRALRPDLYERLPGLEKLRIQITSPMHEQFCEYRPITIFEKAPKLHTIVLHSLLSPSLIVLPWKQLTHFESDGMYMIHCLRALQRAPSLVHCTFTQVKGLFEDEDLPSLLPLPTLKFLRLQGSIHCQELLRIMTSAMPALLALDVNLGFYYEEVKGFVTFPFSPQSECKITELEKVLSWCLAGCLEASTHLVSIAVGPLSVPDLEELLRSLHDSTTFLPNLKSIRTCVSEDGHSKEDVDYEAIVDALAFRWNRNDGSRLESFSMIWQPVASSDSNPYWAEECLSAPHSLHAILPRLLDLVEEGMHISMTASTGVQMSRVEVWV
ncbi:hypothetical protein B0H19DRAFT_297100 [Mycena capillaripes]|nr:hypothetical protein B0H19DRAFT_297100 [Mycena capillaripes]